MANPIPTIPKPAVSSAKLRANGSVSEHCTDLFLGEYDGGTVPTTDSYNDDYSDDYS